MTEEVSTTPHLYAIIAGEVSGDTLGAGLMKAIKRYDPEAKFIGIGGEKMSKCGMVSAFDMKELSVMGVFEVAAHLIPILRIRKKITDILLKARPCVMIGIDSPDFNLYVEGKLKKAGIKTIHYVSPSVWAWREKRIEKIKASCDEVLALLPFEKDFYDQHDMPCTYVGHTLANSIPLIIDQDVARERCGLYKHCVDTVDGKVLAILPGSRRGVISRMMPIYARTAKLLHEKIPDLTFISVAADRDTALLIKDLWLEQAPQISITVFVGNGRDVIASADACLLTCGTIAFEAMLLKTPMTVAYRVSWLTAAIARRLLKVSMYSLPNLLAKKEIVREMIQEDCTPIKLAHECIKLLTSDNLMMKKEFASIHGAIRTNADDLAARTVFKLIGQEQLTRGLLESSVRKNESNSNESELITASSDKALESKSSSKDERSSKSNKRRKTKAKEQAYVAEPKVSEAAPSDTKVASEAMSEQPSQAPAEKPKTKGGSSYKDFFKKRRLAQEAQNKKDALKSEAEANNTTATDSAILSKEASAIKSKSPAKPDAADVKDDLTVESVHKRTDSTKEKDEAVSSASAKPTLKESAKSAVSDLGIAIRIKSPRKNKNANRTLQHDRI